MAMRRILRGSSAPSGLGKAATSVHNSSKTTIKCLVYSSHMMGFKVNGNTLNLGEDGGERKALLVPKAAPASKIMVVPLEPRSREVVDLGLASLLAYVSDVVLHSCNKVVTKPRPWSLHLQMFIERGILDCRFFTLLAVAGTLLGSILCFVEGLLMVLESYLEYFHALSHRSSDQGHVVHLLIEAMDMFLVGTAMFIFGMGLHVMFVGSRNLKGKGSPLLASNFFGLFYLKILPSWVGMQSIAQAKTKIGHTVMMILQVGVLEKFKNIPLVTGLDLACFAASVFVSSACIFLLSRLSPVSGPTAADS